MLTAVGIVAVYEEPKEVPATGGAFLNFQAVGPDINQGSDKYHYYSISLYVPSANLEEARSKLQKNKIINIHSGYWQAQKMTSKEGKEFIANTLRTSWRGASVLGWFQNRKTE